jgi:hypothetical protein
VQALVEVDGVLAGHDILGAADLLVLALAHFACEDRGKLLVLTLRHTSAT